MKSREVKKRKGSKGSCFLLPRHVALWPCQKKLKGPKESTSSWGSTLSHSDKDQHREGGGGAGVRTAARIAAGPLEAPASPPAAAAARPPAPAPPPAAASALAAPAGPCTPKPEVLYQGTKARKYSERAEFPGLGGRQQAGALLTPSVPSPAPAHRTPTPRSARPPAPRRGGPRAAALCARAPPPPPPSW